MNNWIYKIVLSWVLYLVKREKTLSTSLMSQNAFLWKHLKWNMSLHRINIGLCKSENMVICVRRRWISVKDHALLLLLTTAPEEWTYFSWVKLFCICYKIGRKKEGREKSYLPSFIDLCRTKCSTVWNDI